MNRTLKSLLRLLLALALLAGMIPAALAAEPYLELERSTIRWDEMTTVRVVNAPEGAQPVFRSSNTDVATVYENQITALSPGSTQITAIIDDVQIGQPVTLTVVDSVSEVRLVPATDELILDADAPTASKTVQVQVIGAISGDSLRAWANDPAVVSLSVGDLTVTDNVGTASVTLTPKKTGSTTVQIFCGGASVTPTVRVQAQADHTLTFDAQKLTLEKGKTAKNAVTKSVSTDKLQFTSSNTDVATVAADGTVTGVATGTATITASVTTASGVALPEAEASYTVEVTDAYKISLSAVPATLNAGDSAAVYATISRFDAQTGRYVTCTDEAVLTWTAYQAGIAAFDGEEAARAVTTTTKTGSSSLQLHSFSCGTAKTSIQLPLTVSAKINGTVYEAQAASVTLRPAQAESFRVDDQTRFTARSFRTVVDAATGSHAGALAAISIESATNGTVYADGSRVSYGTKYFVSGSGNRLISDLYFKSGSGSAKAGFTYTGYDADGNVIASGSVNVGVQSVDVEYSASFGSSVTFVESDFSRAFSSSVASTESLDYVLFDAASATVIMNSKTYNLADGSNASVFGWVYTTSAHSKKLAATDKCYYKAMANQLDLDAITYLTGTYRTKYTVYLSYTAVGVSGTQHTGFCAITVSGEDTVTASGASMKTLGAADLITHAYPQSAYVTFRAPTASDGRLLYTFNSIVDKDYTAIDFYFDQFYLNENDIPKKTANTKLLDKVFFLPVADCPSQIKLTFTAYSAADEKLGTGALTVNVAQKTASSVFSDVTSRTCSWAAAAVDFMNDYGLVKGVSASRFNWNGNMTRGDFVLILYRCAGSPSVSGINNPFRDVSRSDYYYEAVLWAYRNEIVTGTGSDTFSPKASITREQIVSILWRQAGRPTASSGLYLYTDEASVSSYAVRAMSWAVNAGYLKGSGTKLNPTANASRAEVVVMLHRYLTKSIVN